MMPEHIDAEKLRRQCRRMLGPDLEAFWEECKEELGYEERDHAGKLLVVDLAWAIFYHENRLRIERERSDIQQLPEPHQARALMVLEAYQYVIRAFFTGLRAKLAC
jgi:hypothetical protein